MTRIWAAIALTAFITAPALAEPSSHWINPAKLTAASKAEAAADKQDRNEAPAATAAESEPETTGSVTMTATSTQAWISPAVLSGNAAAAAEESSEGKGVSGKSGKTPAKSTNSYHAIVDRYAKAHGIPAAWARAVVQIESRYNPRATGRAGEIGLMQLKLRTARGMGYTGSRQALYDPETNIKYGMLYLAKAYQLAGGDLCGTILRYNAGHYAKRMSAGPRRYCGRVQGLLKAA